MPEIALDDPVSAEAFDDGLHSSRRLDASFDCQNVLVKLPEFSNCRLQALARFRHLPFIEAEPFHLPLVRKIEFRMEFEFADDRPIPRIDIPLAAITMSPSADPNDKLSKLRSVSANSCRSIRMLFGKHCLQFSS